MFDYFLQDCKANVYDVKGKTNALRKIDKMDVTFFVILIMGIMLLGGVVFYQWNYLIMIGTMILIGEDFAFIIWRNDNDWRKQWPELKKQRQEEIINQIREKMESEEWGIYTRKGISWSIEMCDAELKKITSFPAKLIIVNIYIGIIIPIFTAAEAAILKKLELITMVGAIGIMSAIAMFLLGLGIIAYQIGNIIFGQKREFLMRFKEDLMYLSAKY